MRFFSGLLLFFLLQTVWAQPPQVPEGAAADTVYLDHLGLPVASSGKAKEYVISWQTDTANVHTLSYTIEGELTAESNYLLLRGYLLAHGVERQWYPGGQLKLEAEHQYGRLHGTVRSWWENGQLRRKDEYMAGVLQQGLCLDIRGNLVEHYPHYRRAEFPGGEEAVRKFIIQNLQFIYGPWDLRPEGVVGIRLLVDTLGNLSDAVVVNSLHPELDKEALRLVELMPQWQPAMEEGKTITERVDMHIVFNRNEIWNRELFRQVDEHSVMVLHDTLFLDEHYRKAPNLDTAARYIVPQKTDSITIVERTYNQQGQLLAETSFMHRNQYKVKHGLERRWHSNGQLQLEVYYDHGMMDGTLKTWWENGHLKRQDEYQLGEFIRGICLDPDGAQLGHFDFFTQASFPGGEAARIEYLNSRMKYPVEALAQEKEGIVHLSFVVDSEGNVVEVTLMRGVHPVLDAEAVKAVLHMPLWIPAREDGQKVRSRVYMPIEFRMQDG